MKILIFNHEICVCALLATNSLCAESSAEMRVKMKKVKKLILKVIADAVETEAKKGYIGWPPCIGFIYQPKRPKKK